jgi:hypothetical protein
MNPGEFTVVRIREMVAGVWAYMRQERDMCSARRAIDDSSLKGNPGFLSARIAGTLEDDHADRRRADSAAAVLRRSQGIERGQVSGLRAHEVHYVY